jgi:hypothetical protein
MNNIKLRAWDKSEKKMMYRGIFDRNWYATPANDEGGCHCIREIMPEDSSRIELMQYIWRKDVHDKEIYEGDILRDHLDRYYVIEHRDDEAKFVCRPIFTITWAYGTAGYPFKQCSDLEIIGNTCETPELLNAK